MYLVRKVRESLRLNAAQVDELAPQCGGVRERGYKAPFQTAVNVGVNFNRNLC